MELKDILEAILFSSLKPLSAKELQDILKQAGESGEGDAKEFAQAKAKAITVALETLAEEVENLGRGFRLVCVAGAWQFVTQSEYAPWVRALVGVKNRPARLSKPALETLAIIAYRQPVTRGDIEEIRGVAVSKGTLDLLLEMGFVRLRGRRRTAGRPVTYGTADRFLEHFGLASLYDLPGVQEMKAAGLLDLSAPVGFELPDPSRATGADEEEAPLLDEDSPEFAQDFVGEER